jgi:hypothetical protein
MHAEDVMSMCMFLSSETQILIKCVWLFSFVDVRGNDIYFLFRLKVMQFIYCNILIQNLGFHWKSAVTVETAIFMTEMYLRIHSIIFT